MGQSAMQTNYGLVLDVDITNYSLIFKSSADVHIGHRQHRSKLEHRRICISKSPIPMFLKNRTMYFFTEL